MFKVEKLKIQDLEHMALEPMNDFVNPWLTGSGPAHYWATQGEAYSGFVHGDLTVCCGLAAYWKGRAHIWSVFSKNAEKNFVSVFRGMQKFLASTAYNRIEMDVDLHQPYTNVAHRRAVLLGFTLECPRAVHYRPCGGDSALYAWIRGAQ